MHDLHSYAMKTRHSLFRAAGHIIKATNNAANAAEKGSSIEMRKAKFLLTLAAAAAVMSTAAMSFAQWDTLSANVSGTVTLAKPVTVTAAQTENYTAATRELGGVAPTYTGKITVSANVADIPNDKTANLTLTPKVTTGGVNGTDVTEHFTVVVKDGETDVTGAGKKDTTVTDSNVYTVTVTPIDGDAVAQGYATTGTELTVAVEAQLSAVDTTPAP